MDRLSDITEIVTGGDGALGISLIGLVLLFFGIELYFWLSRYGRIASYRNIRRDNPKVVDGISVVVILTDDFFYLENRLPEIMGQDYLDFELVVIDVSSSPEFADELRMNELRYPNLTTARLDPDPRFRVSNKMIYNIGIKTARYNNVILTTSDASPVSSKWLECMAKGFANGEILIGYCGIEQTKGLGNRLIRCWRFMMSIRYLSSAIRGRTYRGIIQNLGFNKQLYLEKRGFNHLDTTVGEDDLFIQKIAHCGDTSVIMNPHGTMRQTVYGGFSGWWRSNRLFRTTRNLYPGWARRADAAELYFRLLLLLSIIACAIFMPRYTALGAAAIWIGRTFIVRHQAARISQRLGEKGLNWIIIFYDIIEPFLYIFLSVSCHVRTPKEMWK